MNNKKPETEWLQNAPTTPVSVEERRRINTRIKKKHDRLRRKYKEVRGKRVDWIDYFIEEDLLYVNFWFMDRTAFHITFKPQILVDTIELSDWSTGDDKILKKYRR